MKALIVNRIGDFGLSLGIFTIFFVFGAVASENVQIGGSIGNIHKNAPFPSHVPLLHTRSAPR